MLNAALAARCRRRIGGDAV